MTQSIEELYGSFFGGGGNMLKQVFFSFFVGSLFSVNHKQKEVVVWEIKNLTQ